MADLGRWIVTVSSELESAPSEVQVFKIKLAPRRDVTNLGAARAAGGTRRVGCGRAGPPGPSSTRRHRVSYSVIRTVYLLSLLACFSFVLILQVQVQVQVQV